jgi:uncharacterized protein (DUF4415 family)
MDSNVPVIYDEGEVADLTAVDTAIFKPVAEVLSSTLLKKLTGRGPQKAPVKERITIRLSAEVVAQFRATGAGWQGRVDAALKDWLKTHEPI